MGGELRQQLLLRELEKEYKCISYGINRIEGKYLGKEQGENKTRPAKELREAVCQAENLLFPIPFLKQEKINLSGEEVRIEELEKLVLPGQKLYGGNLPYKLKEQLRKKGVVCYDYMEDESIAVYNSIATAEGTIAEILQSFPYNLHGTSVLVLGYGRCARTLVNKLLAMKAKVTVYARRREAGMEAYAQGADYMEKHEFLKETEKFPIVINTIPERIFVKEDLEKIPFHTQIYEIASYPYCMDPKEAEKKKINFFICGGLPGKYSPISSAMILKEYLMEKRKERLEE